MKTKVKTNQPNLYLKPSKLDLETVLALVSNEEYMRTLQKYPALLRQCTVMLIRIMDRAILEYFCNVKLPPSKVNDCWLLGEFSTRQDRDNWVRYMQLKRFHMVKYAMERFPRARKLELPKMSFDVDKPNDIRERHIYMMENRRFDIGCHLVEWMVREVRRFLRNDNPECLSELKKTYLLLDGAWRAGIQEKYMKDKSLWFFEFRLRKSRRKPNR